MIKQQTLFCLVLIWLISTTSNAQSDSTIFTYRAYLLNLLKYHPIAKQADLKVKLGEAELLAAKGNFDPVLNSDWKEKNFDDKLYYKQFRNRLQIPTNLGVNIVGGYENTEGVFLNPENKTDQYGLWNIGIEVNVLQGLLTDERRTALRQAKIFQNIVASQRQIMLNELLFKASKAYLNWQRYHAIEQVINENIKIANTYFRNTKQAYINGEKTAMDTLEAAIILQDRIVLQQKNSLVLVKARQNIENYLWFNHLPLALKAATRPESTEQLFEGTSPSNINTLMQNHPQIVEKLNKQAFYEVAQRWKREKLKPKLKLKYNPLLATTNEGTTPTYSFSDFTWGFDFSMPLFLRKERAALQQGQLKLEAIRLDIQNKQNELQNKIEGSLQQQALLQQQRSLLQNNVNGYKKLLDAENEKFLYGESSVFLLNKRQEKYINGQLKLIELRVKLQTEVLNYLYYTNGLIGKF